MSPHAPVLLDEAIAALQIKSAGAYVDATFGRGGHTRAILERLGENGRVIAMDRDPQAVAAGAELKDARLTLVHARFSELAEILRRSHCTSVDGILLDIGVSSPQLEDARRGFSFRHDGPLDMRMDPGAGAPAGQWLAQAPEREIAEVIRRYGEERFAKQIARAIVAARTSEQIRSTRQLAQIVGQAVASREPGQDPATRTFQAIRIHINQELEELEIALARSLEALKAGGRLVVISFHSLEDRIVKRFMQRESRPDLPARLPLRANELPQPKLKVIGRSVRPGPRERTANPRSRSATLRVAEKLAA
jgi:16S rRNA (cytosine1402-N4)-methyltransferase